MISFLIITLAGLAAGALNAVAGGGTFISFPALVWLGVPPLMANATATCTAVPGYVSSAWAFRSDIRAEGSLRLWQLFPLAVIGGVSGALLLMVTPEELFVGVVPWLLLAATAAFAAGPWLVSHLAGGQAPGVSVSAAAVLAVAIYGGYFNGGLGIMLLAVFGLIGFTNLHNMNGVKNAVSALLSVVSSITYAAAGLIQWDAALLLAVATTAGGFIGAHYARRITNMRALRAGITAVGLAMSAAFFLQ